MDKNMVFIVWNTIWKMPLRQLKGNKDKGENANNFKICNTFSIFKANKEGP